MPSSNSRFSSHSLFLNISRAFLHLDSMALSCMLCTLLRGFAYLGIDIQSSRDPELPETVQLNGPDRTRVDKVKYLGVISDEKLDWGEQFKFIRSIISAGLVSLKQLKSVLLQSQLCYEYYGLVKSHLRYGDIVSDCLSQQNAYSSLTP